MPVKKLMSYMEDDTDDTSSCMKFAQVVRRINPLVLGVSRGGWLHFPSSAVICAPARLLLTCSVLRKTFQEYIRLILRDLCGVAAESNGHGHLLSPMEDAMKRLPSGILKKKAS